MSHILILIARFSFVDPYLGILILFLDPYPETLILIDDALSKLKFYPDQNCSFIRICILPEYWASFHRTLRTDFVKQKWNKWMELVVIFLKFSSINYVSIETPILKYRALNPWSNREPAMHKKYERLTVGRWSTLDYIKWMVEMVLNSNYQVMNENQFRMLNKNVKFAVKHLVQKKTFFATKLQLK